MHDTDKIRYFNVTNATLPMYVETGRNTNYIIYRVDIDVYQKTIGYFENIDISNNTGAYPAFTCYGNVQSELIINGFYASHSNGVFAVSNIQIFGNLEVNNLYFEYTDAWEALMFESSFITKMNIPCFYM